MRLVNIRDRAAVRQLYLNSELEDALGRVLFSWRYNALKSQSEAAKVFDVHRTTYADWEAGAVEIRVGTLFRIKEKGGFELWQLGLGFDEPPVAPAA